MGLERKMIGSIGEDIACSHLMRKGYMVVERNLSTKCGEIDIIARKAKRTIFVEVKTRASFSLGPPYISITREKSRHMIHSAMLYLSWKDLSDTPWQIDVISINIDSDNKVVALEHFENAIERDGSFI